MASNKRNKYKELSISDKIKLLQENESQPTSQRKQVQRIIANKENIYKTKRKDDRISQKRQRLLRE